MTEFDLSQKTNAQVLYVAVAGVWETKMPSNDRRAWAKVYREIAGRICATIDADNCIDTVERYRSINACLRHCGGELLPLMELLHAGTLSECLS